MPALRDALACLASPFDPPEEVARDAAFRGLRTATPLAEPDRLALTALAELVEAGRLRATIAETLALARACRAHELGENGRTTGKLVLTVD